MILAVTVRTNKRSQKIEFLDKNSCFVDLVSPAKENKANFELIEYLSAYYKIPKRYFKIKKGLRSRNKLILIDDGDQKKFS